MATFQCTGTTRQGRRCEHKVATSGATCGRCLGVASTGGTSADADLDHDIVLGEEQTEPEHRYNVTDAETFKDCFEDSKDFHKFLVWWDDNYSYVEDSAACYLLCDNYLSNFDLKQQEYGWTEDDRRILIDVRAEEIGYFRFWKKKMEDDIQRKTGASCNLEERAIMLDGEITMHDSEDKILQRMKRLRERKSQPLLGKCVVVTGKLEGYTRDTVGMAIRDSGGIMQSKVDLYTDVLVVGKRPGRVKVDAATDLGLPILSGEGFKDLLAGKYNL